MRKISVLFVSLSALAVTGLVSCKKQVAAEVEGDWKRMNIATGGVDAHEAIWHFNNGTLIIEDLTDSTNSDTASYVVVEKSLKNYVRIDGLKSGYAYGKPQENGDWRVINYKKDVLMLAKPDESHTTGEDIGTLLREFTRL